MSVGLCPDCGRQPAVLASADDVKRCRDCDFIEWERARRRAEGEAILRDLPGSVRAFLFDAGMAELELTATIEGVPPQLLPMLDDDGVKAMRAGQVPSSGFGLSGPAGHGKTFLLAAVLRQMVAARFRAELPSAGSRALRKWLAWHSWPSTVNEIRVISTRDSGLSQVEKIIEHACSVEVLVLDDVGAERIRGEYSQDWAASQLDLIVDTRHRTMRPTWYTTSRNRDALVQIYGQRIFSRLTGGNPVRELSMRKDLRLGVK